MVSLKIATFLENSSWIRKMFEKGAKLREQRGEENIFDFSLGNPCLSPPDSLIDSWVKHLQQKKTGGHSYSSNAGLLHTRKFLANRFKEKENLDFQAQDIVLSCGAGGGLNVVFHSLINEGDEILVSSPFFPEYRFYAYNHSATLKLVDSKPNFQLDLEAIEKNLTAKTKIFLINSPHNPTGVVYDKESIQQLCILLQKHSQKTGKTLYLVSDEPYSKILYDNTQHTSILKYYENSILVTSHSKDFSLAGERIGYVVIHPEITQKKLVREALVFSNRTLGFVNAPASMQFIIPEFFDLSVDFSYYKENRDFLYQELTNIGYQIVKPQGAFYFFPKSLEENDTAFVDKALDFGILLVPGTGFGRKRHFRLSYAVEKQVVKNSIVAFKELFQYYNKK